MSGNPEHMVEGNAAHSELYVLYRAPRLVT